MINFTPISWVIDKHMNDWYKKCKSCQSVRNNLPTAMLHPWSWPDRPWMRIYVDFVGSFLGSMFMIVVDAHSKWLEVITEKILGVLCNLFSVYRLPEQLVSDNGLQFTSSESELCMRANGIKHIQTSPYHPASNGPEGL